jgi:hypothetical protein
VRRDAAVSEADRDRLHEQYCARALELLRKTEGEGYFRTRVVVEKLEQDPDLAALKGRADYQQFVAGLKQKAKSKDSPGEGRAP